MVQDRQVIKNEDRWGGSGEWISLHMTTLCLTRNEGRGRRKVSSMELVLLSNAQCYCFLMETCPLRLGLTSRNRVVTVCGEIF